MPDPHQLVDEFALRFEAGEDPDPAEWLNRVQGDERQELGELIDRYLMTAPRRTWDPVAYESSVAKQAVDRAFDSLEGVSGTWPELLPRLRNAAQVKRSELVRRLAAALGVGGDEAQLQKVGSYYHRMERGLLPAEGVSGRVIDALAGIVGTSAEAIRRAGGGGREAEGGAGAPAFARMTPPELGSASAGPASSVERADDELDASEPERDEIDRLFTGG